jgi:hypothetical protein
MKKLLSVLICFILFNCGFSQSYDFFRQYDKLQEDTNSFRLLLVDGLSLEMLSVMKITTDTTPIGISPYQTITIESTVPWSMIAGDSIIYGGAGESVIKLWSDKINYIDIQPKL